MHRSKGLKPLAVVIVGIALLVGIGVIGTKLNVHWDFAGRDVRHRSLLLKLDVVHSRPVSPNIRASLGKVADGRLGGGLELVLHRNNGEVLAVVPSVAFSVNGDETEKDFALAFFVGDSFGMPGKFVLVPVRWMPLSSVSSESGQRPFYSQVIIWVGENAEGEAVAVAFDSSSEPRFGMRVEGLFAYDMVVDTQEYGPVKAGISSIEQPSSDRIRMTISGWTWVDRKPAEIPLYTVDLRYQFGEQVVQRHYTPASDPGEPPAEPADSTGVDARTFQDGTGSGESPAVFDFAEGARSSEKAQEAQRVWAQYLGQEIEITNLVDMRLRLIPPGVYMRGGETSVEETARRHGGQVDWFSWEHPRHRVTLTRPFRMGATEVTQGQWKAVMGQNDNPSRFKGDNLPVENVSWHQTVEFCRRLTERERAAGRIGPNQSYRLPTEAEWEYAARAGTVAAYHTGDDEAALGDAGWFRGNSNSRTHPVGGKTANAWGLFDMHGNVWEWCSDWLGFYPAGPLTDPAGPENGEARVLRGGCWSTNAYYCRSAFRFSGTPDYRLNNCGFRVLLDLP